MVSCPISILPGSSFLASWLFSEPTFKGLCLLCPFSPGCSRSGPRGPADLSPAPGAPGWFALPGEGLCRPQAGGWPLDAFPLRADGDCCQLLLWGRCPRESLEGAQAVTSNSRCVRSRLSCRDPDLGGQGLARQPCQFRLLFCFREGPRLCILLSRGSSPRCAWKGGASLLPGGAGGLTFDL